VDSKGLSFYHESKDGQILEEGITEAGSMASFVAAGTAYAMRVSISFLFTFIFMFGPQRVGDEIWLAADSRVRVFCWAQLRDEHPKWRRLATSGWTQPTVGQFRVRRSTFRSGLRFLSWR